MKESDLFSFKLKEGLVPSYRHLDILIRKQEDLRPLLKVKFLKLKVDWEIIHSSAEKSETTSCIIQILLDISLIFLE